MNNNNSIINLTHFNTIHLSKKLFMMRACIEAVQRCHQKHLLHRDIHPRHFILDIQQRCLMLRDSGYTVRKNLCGFYLAKRLVGSFGYIAPELNTDNRVGLNCRYSTQTDVYALGITLASILHLKLNSLRSQRAAHMNDRLFDFMLQSCKNGEKEKAQIYTTMVKLVLVMTEESPKRRPSLTSVLHAVNQLVDKISEKKQLPYIKYE